MKRGLLAVAALLGVAISQVRADYVIIMANVGQKNNQNGGGQRGMLGLAGGAGMFGMRPGGGMGGFPGAGMGGFPGAGMGGQLGRPGGMGGFPGGAMGAMGAAGIGGFRPGGGQFGRPGMGQMGGPGMAQFGSMPPGGMPAQNMGFSGGAGFFGNGGSSSNNNSLRVMAVLETKNPISSRSYDRGKTQTAFVKTDLGNGHLWTGAKVEIIPLTTGGKRLATVKYRFKKLMEDLTKGKDKPSTQDLVNKAAWALEHGLVDECGQLMSSLKDTSHPAVAAFHKVQAALKKSVRDDGAAKRWKQVGQFDRYHVVTSDHYALIHDAQVGPTLDAVNARLAHLEKNLTAFYYYYALREVALEVPQQRLVAVMETRGDPARAFLRDNEIFDSVPVTADSFYSPRHNLVIFCGRRLDQPYSALTKLTAKYWKAIDRHHVIAAKPLAPKGTTLPDYWSAQTLALLTAALDEDGAAAAVSHSGTRQLLTASGLLPSRVTLPHWLQAGTGSFFETPYCSPWKQYGAPHWTYLFSYKKLIDKKKLPAPHQLLRDVITDKYFKESKKGKPSVKARSTAWALTYYLTRWRLPEMMRFYKELSRLPRDLDFDDAVMLRCFARAFGCVDGRNNLDEAKFTVLANNWVNDMSSVAPDNEVQPILEVIYKHQNELDQELAQSNKPQPGQGGTGGFPGFPGGGFPGFPGGGMPGSPGGGRPGFPGGGFPGFPGGGRPGFPGSGRPPMGN